MEKGQTMQRRMWRGLAVGAIVVLSGFCYAGGQGARLPIGAFQARKLAKPPVLDGKIAPGEWDKAFITSGMMTPFGHELHQAKTVMGVGWDEEKFYFLFHCVRGDREWKLWKSVRENDGYSFGDPSVEVWITPPTLVPETYQNVINTYPAVLDQKMIPTRGYTAQGWKGNWELGVTENETEYILEAAIPVADIDGFDRAQAGEVWRFLLCRTSPGAKPRAQASWSLTQGFAELNQHPTVKLVEGEPTLQVRGITSAFTGEAKFDITVIGADDRDEAVTVTLRWHAAKAFQEGDRVETQTAALQAGASQVLTFAGKVPAEKGHFTLTAKARGGQVIFNESFPYVVNGWTPKIPTRPAKAREAKELDLMVRYGPENNIMILRADIIDLPARKTVAGGAIRILDPESEKVLLEETLPPFREWYSNTHFRLEKMAKEIPVADYKRLAATEKRNRNIEKENKKRVKRGQKPLPLADASIPEPKQVLVEVTVTDAAGKALKTESKTLDLLRYNFVWEQNRIGLSEKVIPPWTPVTYREGTVGVWNRVLALDGLGLLKGIDNGGTEQVQSMRLVAVQDGKTVVLPAAPPRLERLVEAKAELSGAAAAGGLALSAQTRVEFDGFVLNDLTIAPAAAAGVKVEKLTLEVVLPEAEATHYCVTAGGWTAAHAETPPYWSSQTTASGMLVGDFTPYIWLTNSERAFLWFADNDKGWITDDDKSQPTQEIIRKDGTVTLRIHFIEVPTELKEATTLRWGYQTFPSRPLPAGWRSIVCSGGRSRYLPSGRNTYFWFDGEWAVLWPYYCSPYPWSFEKSKAAFERFPLKTDHRPMVGSIAHAVARYRDYEGHEFKNYVVDWGSTPGNPSNGNVAQSRGPTDFRLYHYQEWVQQSGFRGLYIDENYLAVEKNFITGGAYTRDDGQLQPGYSYLGLREYFKRMMYMFHENDVPRPNLWQHISSGAAYHSWFGDVFFEGENVEPTDLDFDYIEVLPAGRMRAIGSARCAGGVMTMMCQSQRHASKWEPKHTHQFWGWTMAHDILPEQVREYEVVAQEARLYEDEVEFLPYWQETPFSTSTPDSFVSAHQAGARYLVWVVNVSREDRDVAVAIDWAGTGLTPASTVIVNAETGALFQAEGQKLTVPVLKRDFVAFHLVPQSPGAPEESFAADFETGVDADYAWGSSVFVTAGRQQGPLALTAGKSGRGLLVDRQTIGLWPHLHVTNREGRLTFQAELASGKRGTIWSSSHPAARHPVTELVQPVALKLETEGLVLLRVPPRGKKPVSGDVVQGPQVQPGWHAFTIAWRGGMLSASVDGQAIGSVPVKGLNVCAGTGKALLESGHFLFGDGRGLVRAIDEVRLFRSAE